MKNKLLVGVLCMALMMGAFITAPTTAKACGHLYTAKQNSKVYAIACGGTDSLYVLQNTTSF